MIQDPSKEGIDTSQLASCTRLETVQEPCVGGSLLVSHSECYDIVCNSESFSGEKLVMVM